jgi:hypothetical protein
MRRRGAGSAVAHLEHDARAELERARDHLASRRVSPEEAHGKDPRRTSRHDTPRAEAAAWVERLPFHGCDLACPGSQLDDRSSSGTFALMQLGVMPQNQLP